MSQEINVSELKTNFWRNAAKQKIMPEVEHDGETDTLFFYFANPEKGAIITHYLDQYVSLLFRNDDKEIVGISIEGFERSFAQKYSNHREWQLSKTGVVLPGIKEMKFGVVTSQETHFSFPIGNIEVEKDLKIHPEFAFA